MNTQKRSFATHSDLSVEITDPKIQLKPWSEMWLTLLEILHQLSIKSLFRERNENWDKYQSQFIILMPENLICQWSFQVTPFCCKCSGSLHSKNAKMNKYLPRRCCFWPFTPDDKTDDVKNFGQDKKTKCKPVSNTHSLFYKKQWFNLAIHCS